MTQRRIAEYQTVVKSYDRALALAALLHPGPFRGFDTLAPTGALTFTVEHSTDYYEHLDDDGITVLQEAFWLGKPGVVIIEDAGIGAFTIDTNAGNAVDRIDIVCGVHSWEPGIVGGNAATYYLLKGPLGSSVPPVVTNPDTDVILGYVRMPGNATTVEAEYWTRAQKRGLGDSNVARRDELNNFTTQNQDAMGTNITMTDEGLDLPLDGNLFRVINDGGLHMDRILAKFVQYGTEVNLVFDNDITIRSNTNTDNTTDAADLAAGYQKFVLRDDNDNPLLQGKQEYLVKANTLISFMNFGGLWYIKSDMMNTLDYYRDRLPDVQTGLTPTAGWSVNSSGFNFGGGTEVSELTYWIKGGQLRFRGGFHNTASKAPGRHTITTLPAGYRPDISYATYKDTDQSLVGGSVGPIQLFVHPTGVIEIVAITGTYATDSLYVSMDDVIIDMNIA